MSDVPFHLTVMGRRFYEATMPALVEAIERLNQNLERLAGTGALNAPTAPPSPPAPPNTGRGE
jgi:hypothetical protein